MATTWNPSDKSADISLSDGNLTATAINVDPQSAVVRATTSKSSGKWYFEVQCGGDGGVGVATSAHSTNVIVGWESTGWGYGSGGYKYNGGQTAFALGTFGVGDIIRVAIDLDNNRIWFGKNGSWSGDPTAPSGWAYSNLSGTVYPAVSTVYETEYQKGRFNRSLLSYAPPTGFSVLEDDSLATTSLTFTPVAPDHTGQQVPLNHALPAAALTVTPVAPSGANYIASIAATAPEPVLLLFGGGMIDLSAPTPTLRLTGTVSSNSIALTAPAPTLTMIGGGRIDLTVPLPILAMSGTVPNVGSITLEAPEPTLALTGLVGEVGSIALTAPRPELTLLGGGRITLLAPTPVLSLAGTVPNVGSIVLEAPIPTLSMTGLVGTIGSIALIAPEPTLTLSGLVGTIGSIVLVAPLPTLSLYGTGITTETTYAVNLTTGAVTNLLMGAFDKLVTAHGRLYGMRSGALVRLDGDLDGSATIPATIRFAPQQFGTLLAKRIDGHVYLNLRENDGVTLKLVQDETTSWDYQTPTDNAPAIGTHRVKVGRGITFHSLGLTLKNRAGGRLDVGGLELPVLPLSRKPK